MQSARCAKVKAKVGNAGPGIYCYLRHAGSSVSGTAPTDSEVVKSTDGRGGIPPTATDDSSSSESEGSCDGSGKEGVAEDGVGVRDSSDGGGLSSGMETDTDEDEDEDQPRRRAKRRRRRRQHTSSDVMVR